MVKQNKKEEVVKKSFAGSYKTTHVKNVKKIDDQIANLFSDLYPEKSKIRKSEYVH